MLKKSAIIAILVMFFAGIATYRPKHAQADGSIPSGVLNASSVTDQGTPSEYLKGAHPLGSYGGGSFDNVNLFNGNLSVSLPLASLGGRGGTGVSVVLGYNSKIWRPVTLSYGKKDGTTSSSIGAVWDSWDLGTPMIAPGWAIHAGRMVGRQAGFGQTGGPDGCKTLVKINPKNRLEDEYQFNYDKTITTFTFTSPDGTEYDFRDDLYDGEPQAPVDCQGVSRGSSFHSVDGTGATFISSTDIYDFEYVYGSSRQLRPTGEVALKDGTHFGIDRGQVIWQRDRNGNKVYYEYDNAYRNRVVKATDTLGRHIDVWYNNDYLGEPTFEKDGQLNVLVEVSIYGSDNSLQNRIFVKYDSLDDLSGHTTQPIHDLFGSRGVNANESSKEKFNEYMVSSILLPSGHSWNFTYNKYAEMTQAQLPSGGHIEYEYDFNNTNVSILEPNIFRRVTTRTSYTGTDSSTEEGKTIYSDPTYRYTDIDHPNGYSKVIEEHQDSSSKILATTEHRFYGTPMDTFTTEADWHYTGRYELSRPWREGKEFYTAQIDESGPAFITNNTWHQWQSVAWQSDSYYQDSNNPRLTQTTKQWTATNQLAETDYSYEDYSGYTYNNISREVDYDYGNGTRGSLLRQIDYTYVSSINGVNVQTDFDKHLRSLIDTVSISDPLSTETVTKYRYDEYSNGNTSAPLQSATIIGNSHDSTFDSSYLWRGNVTSITRGFSSSDHSTSYAEYDTAGNMVKVFSPNVESDPANSQHYATEITYTTASDFSYTFPYIAKTYASRLDGTVKNFTTTRIFDINTGQLTSITGPNGDQTTYEYHDSLYRLTKVTPPSGAGITTFGYSLPTESLYVHIQKQLDSTRNLDTYSNFDGLGQLTNQSRNDVASVVNVDTTYDGLGRASTVTNPYRNSSDDTNGFTLTAFDRLGRVTSVTTQDKDGNSTGTVNSTYSGTTVTVTDQTGKKRQSTTDALGRIVQVIEPDSSSGDLASGTATTTSYTYDARGNLKTVNQSYPNPTTGLTTSQNRTFVYNALSELVQSTNPESGTVTYTYDYAGNVKTRTDARSIITTYNYDELNRLLTKTYSSDPANTPSVTNYYDDFQGLALPSGLSIPALPTPNYPIGHLVATITNASSPTGTLYSYDINGRATGSSQLLDGAFYTSSNVYNLNSQPTTENYPSTNTITSTYNDAGQLANTTLNASTMLSSSTTYTASGGLSTQSLGNGLYHNINYNSRLQPTVIGLSSDSAGGSYDKLKLSYDYGLLSSMDVPGADTDQSRNNGNVSRMMIEPGDGHKIEHDYSYDKLNRISEEREFGNTVATVTTTPTGAPCYIPVTNKTASGDADAGFEISNRSALYEGPRTKSSANAVIVETYDLTDAPATADIWAQINFGFAEIIRETGGFLEYNANNTHSDTRIQIILGSTNSPDTHYLFNKTFHLSVDNNGQVTLSAESNSVAAQSPGIEVFDGQGNHDVDYISSDLGNSVPDVDLNPYKGAAVAITYIVNFETTANPQGYYPPFNGDFWTQLTQCGDGNFTRTQTTMRMKYSQQHQYDPFGNRSCCTPMDDLTPGQGVTIDQSTNRISGLCTSGNCYDYAGNVTSQNGSTYSYDAENHMIGAITGSGTATYTYDGNGKRVEKNDGTTTTRFIYNAAGQLIAEYAGSTAPAANAPTKEYYYGPSGLLAINDNGTLHYITPDHLGSTRLVTDGSGAVISRHDFYAFGDEIAGALRTNGDGTPFAGYGNDDNVKQKFTGYQRDDESGLDFAQARYFESSVGRFLSPDPTLASIQLSSPQSWDRYTYVQNNPLIFTDPTGLNIQVDGNTSAYENDINTRNGIDDEKKKPKPVAFTIKVGKEDGIVQVYDKNGVLVTKDRIAEVRKTLTDSKDIELFDDYTDDSATARVTVKDGPDDSIDFGFAEDDGNKKDPKLVGHNTIDHSDDPGDVVSWSDIAGHETSEAFYAKKHKGSKYDDAHAHANEAFPGFNPYTDNYAPLKSGDGDFTLVKRASDGKVVKLTRIHSGKDAGKATLAPLN